MLIDTHTHLYWDSFKEDFDEVIKRALEAEVNIIINVGVDVEKSKEALRQILETDWPSEIIVYSTIGIHPHEAYKYVNNTDVSIQEAIERLEQIYLSDPSKVVAIGECGLDYCFETDEFYPGISISIAEAKNLQIKLLQAQIDLAKKLNLPLIIHCRDNRSKNPENTACWDKVIDMTKDHFGIYHCYSGLPQTTNYILQTTQFLISFAGNLTYPKNEYLREAAKLIPLDRIVLETDCPFLPPQSKRGQRNEPANVREIAQLIAQLKETSLEEVATKTTANATQIFAF